MLQTCQIREPHQLQRRIDDMSLLARQLRKTCLAGFIADRNDAPRLQVGRTRGRLGCSDHGLELILADGAILFA